MDIFLSLRTAGVYGGRLNGDISHFSRFIESELIKTGFNSSFNEFEIVFCYPPMYVLPGVVGIEVDFKKYYETLPYSRLDRRYKKVEIALKAPEFSENLQKADQIKYDNKFDIENKYKHLTETELAKIVVDKYLEAGEIIKSKLKNGDHFDFEIFKNTLLKLRQKLNPEFLGSTNAKQINIERENGIRRANERRDQRKQNEKPKDKQIRDLRIYYCGLPERALYPYDYQYTEIFLNILKKNGLLCPNYHHLYIQVCKTFEDGLLNSIALEDWYANGISIIDYDRYTNLSETEKEKTVFGAIINGLNDISTIDKLDNSIIEKTINQIKQNGLNTELEYNSIENKKYKLKITYFSKSWEEECPIYFTIMEKSTGKSGKIQIGSARNSQIYLWLQKVTIANKMIKIKSSNSITAQVWLEDKPRLMEFNILDILNK